MQKIESDDAIHLFCVGSAEPTKDELVLDADGGSITFTSADGTVHTYQSEEKGLRSNAGYSVWDKEKNRLSDSDCEVKVHVNTWK